MIPWERLLELTKTQDFLTHMDQTIEIILARSGARPLGLSPDTVNESSEANPTHREDFTSLLHSAAKKKPQGGQTSHGESVDSSDDS